MRFGLKALLAAMGLLGIVLYLLFAAPRIVASTSLIFIWVVLAAFLTAGIVYGRGSARACCVGAIFPAGGTFFALVWVLLMWLLGGFNNMKDFQSLFEYLDKVAFTLRVWSASGWIMSLLAGAACVAGRIAWTPKSIAACDK
jgi:hypothetical protein